MERGPRRCTCSWGTLASATVRHTGAQRRVAHTRARDVSGLGAAGWALSLLFKGFFAYGSVWPRRHRADQSQRGSIGSGGKVSVRVRRGGALRAVVFTVGGLCCLHSRVGGDVSSRSGLQTRRGGRGAALCGSVPDGCPEDRCEHPPGIASVKELRRPRTVEEHRNDALSVQVAQSVEHSMAPPASVANLRARVLQ